MYARSTTIVAQPESIDRGIIYAREELLPEIMAVEGCTGLSTLVDRATGRCIATSAWRSSEAMRASAEPVRPLRDHLVATFGAVNATVEEWEIVVMHRDHQVPGGAYARTTWMRSEPASLDRSIAAFKMVIPTLEGIPTFCSTSLLVDRQSGRAVSTATYDSRDALVQTRDQIARLRTRVAEESGAAVLDVVEFEVALAHLRVPEMV